MAALISRQQGPCHVRRTVFHITKVWGNSDEERVLKPLEEHCHDSACCRDKSHPLCLWQVRRSSEMGESENHLVPEHASHSLSCSQQGLFSQEIPDLTLKCHGCCLAFIRVPLSLESLYHPHYLIAKASSSVDPVLMSCRRKPMCLCRNFCVCKSRQGIDSCAGQPQGQGSLLHPVAHKREMPLGINRYCCPQCSE